MSLVALTPVKADSRVRTHVVGGGVFHGSLTPDMQGSRVWQRWQRACVALRRGSGGGCCPLWLVLDCATSAWCNSALKTRRWAIR